MKTLSDNSVVTLAAGRQVGLACYGADGGFPVLAFHGTPASRLMYRKGHQMALKLGLKLIAPDRPGYGLTPLDENPSLAERTQLNMAIADALKLDRFALIGISGGGPYATALAAYAPERVTALSLVSPMGPVADYIAAGKPPLPLMQRRFFMKLSQRRRVLTNGAKIAVSAFHRAPLAMSRAFRIALGGDDRRILSDAGIRDSLIEMTEEAVKSGPAGAIADFAIFGKPWNIDFSAIAAPATVWAGTADKVVPVPVCRYLSERISNCKYREVPGAGHFWILSNIGRVLGDLREQIHGSSGAVAGRPADMV